MRDQTKRFAIGIVRLVRLIPRTPEGKVVGNQLLRAGSSVAANYRAVCRARTKPEFVAKIGVVVEEADESAFWLEFLIDADIMPETVVRPHLKEANELVAIFAASQRTARAQPDQ